MTTFQPIESLKNGSVRFAEVALALGPLTEGAVGDGSLAALHGSPWALVWSREDLALHLYRWDGGSWLEQPPSAALPVLPSPPIARHLSLAFDQAARPAVAWEENGALYVRQFDSVSSTYVTRGPFVGRDPVLLWDAPLEVELYPGSLKRPPPDTDVVLFYLSSDRLAVNYRLQRELFDTEHPLYTATGEMYLDQVIDTGQRRYQLALSDASNAKTYLTSEGYVWRYADPVRLSARPTEIRRTLDTYQALPPIEDRMRLGARPSEIRRTLDTYQAPLVEDRMRLSARPAEVRRIANTVQFSTEDRMRLSARPTEIRRTVSIVVYEQPEDRMRLSAKPTEIRRKQTS